MDNAAFHQLLDDTIHYLKGMLPKKAAPPPVKKREIIPSPPPKKPEPPPSPKVETPPPKVVKEVVKKPGFELEPPSVPSKEPTESMRKILQEIDPDLFLHDSPPSDEGARRIKEAWKEKRDTPTIPILFQGRKYRPFLESIAKAIDITFGTCRLIEVEEKKKWDLFLESPNLKLIIAPDYLIFQAKELLPFYRENPQEKVRHLGEIPLLLLPDLSLYYKDPYLKRSLWNVITQNLQPLF